MTNHAIKLTSETSMSCAVSGAFVYEGYYLIGEGSKFVSTDVYNSTYKTNYPQSKKTLIISPDVARRILDKKGDNLPVGFILGEKVSPQDGETQRYVCTDCIFTPLVRGSYLVTAADKKRYDVAVLRKKILGRFFCNRTLDVTPLEEHLYKNTAENGILLVIQNENVGGQRAKLKAEGGEELGVIIR